jgi:cell division protein FtsB
MDRISVSPGLLRIVRNKYFIAAFIFILWVTLFDENNLLERFGLIQELNQIEKDRKYYKSRIKEDAERLKELQTNDKNLEKFAREQYLMRKDNEDVFFIVKEK